MLSENETQWAECCAFSECLGKWDYTKSLCHLSPAVNTKRNKAAEWIFQSIQPAADILLSAGVEALKVFTERVEDGQTEWINNGGGKCQRADVWDKLSKDKPNALSVGHYKTPCVGQYSDKV